LQRTLGKTPQTLAPFSKEFCEDLGNVPISGKKEIKL
jgi:hypothetical protein